MTYRQLAEEIMLWPADMQDCDISLYSKADDAYYEAGNIIEVAQDDGVLDDGHPYLVIYDGTEKCVGT